jgi:hypothetical protein
LLLLQGALLLVPPVALIYTENRCLGAVFFVLVGGVWTLIALASIVIRFFGLKPKEEKFPAPNFGFTNQSGTIFAVFFGAAAVGVIGEQVVFASENLSLLTVDMVKLVASTSALYTLLMVLVERAHRSDRIAWTYQLETDLLLGDLSPESVARKIELRGLGLRVQDVMDRYIEDIDRRFVQLAAMIDQGAAEIESIKDVPKEYRAEREARYQAVMNPIVGFIDALRSDCGEFGSYLEKIRKSSGDNNKSALSVLVSNLMLRNKKYEENLNLATARVAILLGK